MVGRNNHAFLLLLLSGLSFICTNFAGSIFRQKCWAGSSFPDENSSRFCFFSFVCVYQAIYLWWEGRFIIFLFFIRGYLLFVLIVLFCGYFRSFGFVYSAIIVRQGFFLVMFLFFCSCSNKIKNHVISCPFLVCLRPLTLPKWNLQWHSES